MTTPRLFLGIFFLALLAMTAKNATDPDLGWHLRTGEFIVTTQSIPHADFFSYTAAGEQWITHEWLAEIVIYVLFQFGGTLALVLFFGLGATLTFWLLYLRCEGKPYLAAFVVIFAAVAAAPIWGIRPQTISLFLTSAFLYILTRYRREGNWHVLLWLVPLILIWANSHGSFVLGPLLILTYLVGDWLERVLKWNGDNGASKMDPRALMAILLATIAAIVVNPNGFELYPYPFQTLSSRVIQTYIQEWQPPNFHDPGVQPFLFMLVATLGLLAISRKRIGVIELLLLLGFTYASLRSVRQISIWVLIAAPIMSAALLELYEISPWKINLRLQKNPSVAAQILNGLILVVVALAVSVRIAATVLDQPRAERAYFPVAAVEWIQREGQRGPIFNLYDWGGYLIWKRYPNERVFIDGRSDLYGLTGDRVVGEYLATINGGANWRDALEKYQVRLVLIPPDSPLASLLQTEQNWRKVYTDNQATIYLRQ